MKVYMLKADNSKDMEKISEELSQKKFKIREKQDNYILMSEPENIFYVFSWII